MSVVTDYLEEKGIAFEVIPHERAFTGMDEARALGIDAHHVLKTVVLDTNEGHVALVLPSEERVDMSLVKEEIEDPGAHLASEDEVVRDFPDFEPGALPPIAPLLGVETLVDPTVPAESPVLFAAGSQTVSVKVDASDLFGHQPARFVQISDAWRR